MKNKKIRNSLWIISLYFTVIILFHIMYADELLTGAIFKVTFLIIIVAVIIIVFKYSNYSTEVNRRRYEMAVKALNGAVIEWDSLTKELYISSNIKKYIDEKSSINSMEKFISHIKESDRQRVKAEFETLIKNNVIGEFKVECILIGKKNIEHYIEIHGTGTLEKNKYSIYGILLDVTEKRNNENLIIESDKKYRLVIEGSKDIIFRWYESTGEVVFDKKILKYFNYDGAEEITIPHNHWKSFVYAKDVKIYNDSMDALMNNDKDYYELEYRIIDKDGKVVWIHSKGRRVKELNGNIVVYGSLSDITDRKEKELKIHFMSYYDDVTGIQNRRYFEVNVNNAINEIKDTNEGLAIIYIDLDNFKYVNDTYGHDVGDALLVKFCEIIYGLLREKSIFARFGGDEFVIAKYGENIEKRIIMLLDSLIEELNKPIRINGKDLYCTPSMGVSFYDNESTEINSLLKKADMAMYTAKSNGKNGYKFFDIKMLDKMNREFSIEKGLRSAIEQDELFMVYQPKINTNTKDIVGFESLVRWKSKELGMVSPGEFIPIAENSGIIVPIGFHIMRESFKKAREMKNISQKNIKMAINLSDVQIRDESLISYIKELIEEFNLNPSVIEFEITEGVIMKSVEKNIEVLKELKTMGFSIALDDFGTGYSSLNYLKILPIDIVKIDKSFIDGIGNDEKSEYIIESIIDLCHFLKMKVVAEGVETEEQYNYLFENNCDIIQGYYFSKPDDFNKFKLMI